MSSDNIYAQLRSWYTGLRSASDLHRHLENATVSNTPGGDTEHYLDEADGPVHTLHHELLASPHIINRPWPAPQQALRNTLSNASLNKDFNRSRPVTREAEGATDQAREVVDSPDKRSDNASNERDIKEPTTPQSSPGRNLTRAERTASQSSSVKSDRPDLWTIKSNKLRRRLERGKSASTVAQATVPASPSHLVSPISKRRHTGGHNIKPSDVEDLLTSISREGSKPELANPISPPSRQGREESLSTTQYDDELAEQPRISTEDGKGTLRDVKPQDATGSMKPNDSAKHEEPDLPISLQESQIGEHPQLDEPDSQDREAYERRLDDDRNSLQSGPDFERATEQRNDAETDVKPEEVEATGSVEPSSQGEEDLQTEAGIRPPNPDEQGPSPNSAEEQAQADSLNDNPPAPSQDAPSTVMPHKLPAGDIRSSKARDTGHYDGRPKSQTSILQKSHSPPLSNKQNSIQHGPPIRRTNYLSFVDTRYLYDPPPLGPAGFFPKEAFPNVEPLRVF